MRLPFKTIGLILILAVFNVVFTADANAQLPSNVPVTDVNGQITPTAFDQRVINLMKRWRIPGASIAIIQHNTLILAHGYGWANLQRREAVTPNSLFRVGSVSKAITAVATLKLVQEKKLSLDDKVFDVLNDLTPLNKKRISQTSQITVRNLLQMSSGWQTNHIDPMFGPWSSRMIEQLTIVNDEVPPNCETATRLMMGIPLQFRPGTQFSYSNLNYCMLGLIINKITGGRYNYMDYQNYVQQHILAPLGITDMRIGDTLPKNRAPNEVTYYSYPTFNTNPGDDLTDLAVVDGLPYSNTQILKRNYSDGGWIASAVDLAKFLNAVANGQILSPYMVRVMLEKPSYKQESQNYFAMGWNVRMIEGHRYWMKTGSFTGTYAVIIQGDDGTTYATVFNIKPTQRIQFLAQLRRVLVTI